MVLWSTVHSAARASFAKHISENATTHNAPLLLGSSPDSCTWLTRPPRGYLLVHCSFTLSSLSPPPPSQPQCWNQHRTALSFPYLSCFLSAPEVSTRYSSISLLGRLNKIVDIRCLFLCFECSKCLNKGLTAETSDALYESEKMGETLPTQILSQCNRKLNRNLSNLLFFPQFVFHGLPPKLVCIEIKRTKAYFKNNIAKN